MTNTTNLVPAKIAALVAGLGLVAMSFAALAPTAQAQTTTTTTTTTSLQAQIAMLQAQLAALIAQIGGQTTGPYVQFNTNLTIGSRGADVTSLQQFLVAKRFLQMPANVSYGYFGPITRAAVAAYQAANGIAPAVGYFGPITRAHVNSSVAVVTPTPTPTPDSVLTGNGRITSISSLGDVTTDLKEGDGTSRVVGVSLDAINGDVRLQRVDADFIIAAGVGSANLDKYVDSVSLYVNGTKVATLDASSGEKNGRTWSFRFAGLTDIIKRDRTANVYVAVTPVSSVGSDESAKTITARIPVDGIRATAADGISENYVSTAISQDFTVSTATTGTLAISANGSNPRDSRVAVNASNTTSDVTLLAFDLRAKNQTIVLDDLPVSLSTSDNNLNDVVSTVKLMKGSTVIKSKTVSSGSYGVVVFDNINQTISAGNMSAYSVVVDLKSNSGYANGTTLVASTTSSLAGFDVQDNNGDTVTPTGSAVGGSLLLSTTGISVTKSNATTQKTTGLTGSGDTTQYTIVFAATAGDDDIYVDRSVQQATSPSATGAGVAWATTTSSTASVTGTGVASFSAADSNSSDTTTSFKIAAGTTRTFTMNVSLTATAAGYTGVRLTGVNFDTDTNTNDSASYYTSGLDNFKTDDVYMQMR